jgi:outer membrane protein assembly factor BamE (lipoprotein component of BamABCDE complex)
MSPVTGWHLRTPLPSQPADPTTMRRVAMRWRVMLVPRRFPSTSPLAKTVTCFLGLFAVLLALDGCFFFRAKPDLKVQEMANRLSPGMTTEEVLELVGPPQRRGQNLFDKKKEYWIYEFSKEVKKKQRRSRDGDGNTPETVVESELQLLFERGKLVNWNVIPHNV